MEGHTFDLCSCSVLGRYVASSVIVELVYESSYIPGARVSSVSWIEVCAAVFQLLHALFHLFTGRHHARVDRVMGIASGSCRGESSFGKP